MPWHKTREDRLREAAKREHTAETYADPEYKRNRETCKRQAAGHCAKCRHRHRRLQCDHKIPVTQGGTHKLANLQMLCVGEDSCKCHEQKTATEGGGARTRGHDPDPRPRTNWT